MDELLRGRVLTARVQGRPAQQNTSNTRRSWQRQPCKIPISLAWEADPFEEDIAAITVDISPNGLRVRTKLVLVRGVRVKVVANVKLSHVVTALVIWVRKDEPDLSTVAGLELLGRLGR